MASNPNQIKQQYWVKGGTIVLTVQTAHALGTEELSGLQSIANECAIYAEQWPTDVPDVERGIDNSIVKKAKTDYSRLDEGGQS